MPSDQRRGVTRSSPSPPGSYHLSLVANQIWARRGRPRGGRRGRNSPNSVTFASDSTSEYSDVLIKNILISS